MISLKKVFLLSSVLFLLVTSSFVYGQDASEVIGTLCIAGVKQFDCETVANKAKKPWRWLSIPYSRLVLNPSYNCGTPITPMAENLPLDIGYWYGDDCIDMRDVLTVSSGGQLKSLKTVWYPYKLSFEADYPAATKIKGNDFFYDEDTIIRALDVESRRPADDTHSLLLKGSLKNAKPTWQKNTGTFLIEMPDFYYAIKFFKTTKQNPKPMPLDLEPEIHDNYWTLHLPLNNSIAIVISFATKRQGSQTAIDKVCSVKYQPSLADILAKRKNMWDKLLGSVPAPLKFGIDAVSANGVTAQKHRLFYYGAWSFVISGLLPVMPENDYPYLQMPCGKPSRWTGGSPRARATATWDSFFGLQLLGYVMPEAASNAFKGIMSDVDETGWLAGECLPSRKAQTAWVLYSLTGDKSHLESTYPAIKRYLIWREKNPRWIWESHNIKDEKDSSFVVSLISDINNAIKIANVLEKNNDVQMWKDMKAEVFKNYRKWFFYDDGRTPENFYFTTTGSHAHRLRPKSEQSYVLKGLYLKDLPKDMLADLKNYYLKVHNPKKRLVGFDFIKYPEATCIACGLLDNSMDKQARQFIDALIRDSILAGEFCERLSIKNEKPVGVIPSLFTACQIIDFTWLKNGMRMDYGTPRPIGKK